MNKSSVKYLLVSGFVACALVATGCGKAEIGTYVSKDKIWFTQTNDKNEPVHELVRSFSHYPGAETLDVDFEVNLIGKVVEYDRIYRVVAVDSLTTASVDEYELQPAVLHGGMVRDRLRVTLRNTPRLQDKEVKLTLHIVANEAFDPGYDDRLQVCVRFSAITTRPDWWTEEVAKSYFGPYSKEKFEAFYAYSGRNDIAGLEPSELRKLLLGFKNYIREHNITEADGSEMVIPVY